MIDVDDGTAITLGLGAAFVAGAEVGDVGAVAILALVVIMLGVLALVDGVGGEDDVEDEVVEPTEVSSS